MLSYQHNPIECRTCHQIFEAATPLSPGANEDLDGGFSVCAYCSEVSIYVVSDGVVSIREATLVELEEFSRKYGRFVQSYNKIAADPHFFTDGDVE